MDTRKMLAVLTVSSVNGLCTTAGTTAMNYLTYSNRSSVASGLTTAVGMLILQSRKKDSCSQPMCPDHGPSLRHAIHYAYDNVGLLSNSKSKVGMIIDGAVINTTEAVIASMLGYCILAAIGLNTATLGETITDCMLGTMPFAMLAFLIVLSVPKKGENPQPRENVAPRV